MYMHTPAVRATIWTFTGGPMASASPGVAGRADRLDV